MDQKIFDELSERWGTNLLESEWQDLKQFVLSNAWEKPAKDTAALDTSS